MKQSAAERPDPTVQRKAAIARGAALEHTGKVLIKPIQNFDLDRTIFKTLEGSAARYVMTTRVGKEAHFDPAAAIGLDFLRVKNCSTSKTGRRRSSHRRRWCLSLN